MRGIALLLAFFCFQIYAAAPGRQDSWLDQLTGDWVLQGTIDGKTTTHDIHAEWVLGHQYVQMHEVSRERDADGRPAYEATVFISWDPRSQEYACLWLDSTSGDGLTTGPMGHGKRSGNAVTFLFRYSERMVFHTTFEYDAGAATWTWRMDSEAKGKYSPFARVKLTR